MSATWEIKYGDDADLLVKEIESRGLGWDIGYNGRLAEARVWNWPYVVGRYRPHKTEPLAEMLAGAMQEVNWEKFPVVEEAAK